MTRTEIAARLRTARRWATRCSVVQRFEMSLPPRGMHVLTIPRRGRALVGYLDRGDVARGREAGRRIAEFGPATWDVKERDVAFAYRWGD